MEKTVVDQMGRQVSFSFPPKRIVSLVPSQTELLFDLGLDNEVVGITKFCVHPNDKWRTKPRIGGTKKIDLEKIKSLNPDLIIGNKEENEKTSIEQLEQLFPVWMSDISTLEEALEMLREIGRLVDKEENSTKLIETITAAFSKIAYLKNAKKKAAYFIWRNPYMVAASQTFIDSMLQVAGFINVFSDKTRYPEIALEELQEQSPEVILLSSEPYPFKEEHFPVFKRICPTATVLIVDGELFSWYGSRMLKAPSYFSKLHALL